MKRNALLLLMGRTVSKFGAGFYLIALPLEMLSRTGSLAQSGLFFTLAALPSVLMSPFLGVMVERLRRKTVIAGTDFVSGLIYSVLLLCGNIYALLAGTMLLHVLSGAFEIASKVAVAELIEKDDLQRYNGLQSACDNIASVVAPMAGAALYGAFGFDAVLAVSAGMFFVSAAQELLIRFPKVQAGPAEGGVLRQIGEGMRFVRGRRGLLGLFVTVMALNFFVANSEEVIYPGMLQMKHGIEGGWYGIAMAAFVAGSLAASVLLAVNKKLDLRGKMRPLIITSSALTALMGVLSLLLAGHPWVFYGAFLLLSFLTGGMNAMVNVPLAAHFQTEVSVHMQGRFFSLVSFGSQLLVPLGVSVAGMLAEAVGADVAFIINNMMAILVAVFALKGYA